MKKYVPNKIGKDVDQTHREFIYKQEDDAFNFYNQDSSISVA
jgi:hypothetical protein